MTSNNLQRENHNLFQDDSLSKLLEISCEVGRWNARASHGNQHCIQFKTGGAALGTTTEVRVLAVTKVLLVVQQNEATYIESISILHVHVRLRHKLAKT